MPGCIACVGRCCHVSVNKHLFYHTGLGTAFQVHKFILIELSPTCRHGLWVAPLACGETGGPAQQREPGSPPRIPARVIARYIDVYVNVM